LSGVASQEVKPIVASAIALFNRYRRVEIELATAKALLDERRQTERAKAILMKNRKMTEPEAYRWLQKKAMNESRKLSQVVAEFVAGEDALKQKAKP
jgi:response regulator NasT